MVVAEKLGSVSKGTGGWLYLAGLIREGAGILHQHITKRRIAVPFRLMADVRDGRWEMGLFFTFFNFLVQLGGRFTDLPIILQFPDL